MTQLEQQLPSFIAGLTFGWGDRVTPLFVHPSPALVSVAVELTALPTSRQWSAACAAVEGGGTWPIKGPFGDWHLALDGYGVLSLLAPGEVVAPRTMLGPVPA